MINRLDKTPTPVYIPKLNDLVRIKPEHRGPHLSASESGQILRVHHIEEGRRSDPYLYLYKLKKDEGKMHICNRRASEVYPLPAGEVDNQWGLAHLEEWK